MADLLQSLAQGLRGAAGVLSPAVQQQTFQQDQRQQEMAQQEMIRRRNLAAQQIIKGAEMGAIEPEAAKMQLQRLGFGEIPVGPSVETQQRLRSVEQDKLFRQELDAAGGDMQKMAQIATKYGKPELAVSMFNAQETRAARELQAQQTLAQKQAELEARIQQAREANASRQQIAEMMLNGRRELAQLAASLRQPPQQQIVQTETGPMVLGPNAQARPITGPDGQPVRGKPAKPSAAVEKELLSIDQQERVIDGGLKAVQDVPTAFTFTRGAATMTGPLTESIAGRFDNPKEQEARSYVFNIVSKVINERAGAAQSAQELARLRSFLPAETDSPQQIKSKLTAFKNYLSDQRSAVTKISGHSPSQSILDQADAIIGGSR